VPTCKEKCVQKLETCNLIRYFLSFFVHIRLLYSFVRDGLLLIFYPPFFCFSSSMAASVTIGKIGQGRDRVKESYPDGPDRAKQQRGFIRGPWRLEDHVTTCKKGTRRKRTEQISQL
jgi:hypothetical protein